MAELIGYREWTESLGFDREWRIQNTQSNLYKEVQREASRLGGYVVPLRYDYMLLLTSNIDEDGEKMLFEILKTESPVPVRMTSAVGSTPLESVTNAFQGLPREPGYRRLGDTGIEVSAVAHVDINSVTKYTRTHGPIEAYKKTLEILWELVRSSSRFGGIVQYLGGDNFLVLLPPEEWVRSTEKLLVGIVKVGAGRSRVPRRSMELATRALDEIREGKVSGLLNLLDDVEA